MNPFEDTRNLHLAQSTTPGVQTDAAKDTTKAKEATKKGGVPTASSTHENSHEPKAGNTPPSEKPGAPNGAAA